MGLDFTIYAKYKGNDSVEVKDVELAYGRKSWELVRFLNLNADEFDVSVNRVDWDRLMNAISEIANDLENIRKAFSKMNNLPDDFPEMVLTNTDKMLIAEYELWHNQTFDEDPYLGYDFSVAYMMDFWEARDDVNYYFNHPDKWEVRAEISY